MKLLMIILLSNTQWHGKIQNKGWSDEERNEYNKKMREQGAPEWLFPVKGYAGRNNPSTSAYDRPCHRATMGIAGEAGPEAIVPMGGGRGGGITQNITINGPPLTPSEIARKNLQVSRQLAMEWGCRWKITFIPRGERIIRHKEYRLLKLSGTGAIETDMNSKSPFKMVEHILTIPRTPDYID